MLVLCTVCAEAVVIGTRFSVWIERIRGTRCKPARQNGAPRKMALLYHEGLNWITDRMR